MCQVLATPSHAGLSQSGEEVPCIAGSMKIGSAQGEILFLHPWKRLGSWEQDHLKPVLLPPVISVTTHLDTKAHQRHRHPTAPSSEPAEQGQTSSSVGTCRCKENPLFAPNPCILHVGEALYELPRRTGAPDRNTGRLLRYLQRFMQFPRSLTERWLDCVILQSYWRKLFATVFTLASWWQHLFSIC